MLSLFNFFKGVDKIETTSEVIVSTVEKFNDVSTAGQFTAEQIDTIMGTLSLVQGICLLFIAIVAIYILYKVISHFF